MNDPKNIAVMIDADNTQLAKLESVLGELSKYGRVVVKRAYGNWRKDVLKNWESEIKRLAIKAEQQFDYVSGKSATDMALVIDTMELLYTQRYDVFAIVSSDSDYTPLAMKLQEWGMYVMGVGEKKTPASFQKACDVFVLLENLPVSMGTQAEKEPPAGKADVVEQPGKPAVDGIDHIHRLLKKICAEHQKEKGFTDISAAGQYLRQAKPDFDCRTYGFKKLSELLAAFPDRYQIKRTANTAAYKCLK